MAFLKLLMAKFQLFNYFAPGNPVLDCLSSLTPLCLQQYLAMEVAKSRPGWTRRIRWATGATRWTTGSHSGWTRSSSSPGPARAGSTTSGKVQGISLLKLFRNLFCQNLVTFLHLSGNKCWSLARTPKVSMQPKLSSKNKRMEMFMEN